MRTPDSTSSWKTTLPYRGIKPSRCSNLQRRYWLAMPMKLLLDESAPRRLVSLLPRRFEVRSVQQMGWAGIRKQEDLRTEGE